MQKNDILTDLWYAYSHSSSAPECCDSSEQTFCTRSKNAVLINQLPETNLVKQTKENPAATFKTETDHPLTPGNFKNMLRGLQLKNVEHNWVTVLVQNANWQDYFIESSAAENYLKAASETCWQPRRLRDFMKPPQCFDNFSITKPYKTHH